jgi:hypothetical protein
MDPKSASASDCVPESTTDGDAVEAALSPAGDTLSVCLAYHSAVTEARTGRACYAVDLTAGRYDRIGPFTSAQANGDRVAAALAEHASASGDFNVKTTATDVTACKGADCTTLHVDGFTLPNAPPGGECIPAALTQGIPADVSPDGATVFLVRHEACDGHIFGETYDVKTKRRAARFPMSADSFVERVMWVGRRVLVRTCMDDLQSCALQSIDPAAPATPAPHGFANSVALDINTAGLDKFVFHAKDDLWAVVDRLGGSVAFVHADTGAIDHTLQLAAAPTLQHPLIAGVRPSTPNPQLFLFYGGTGQISLIDLAGGQVTSTLSAPVCGGEHI